MKMRVKCRFCSGEFSSSTIQKHENACEKNPESLTAKRLSETAICPINGVVFHPWKRWPKRGAGSAGWKRNQFCSRRCAAEANAALETPRTVSPAELERRKKAGKRLADWHRSEEGRAFHRAQTGPKRGMIRPEHQNAAATILANVLSKINGRPVEISVGKIDGRLLVDNSGTNNPRAHSVVRLTDRKIYEYAGQAVADVNGKDSEISKAIRTGSYHRGHQFMLWDAWVEAGKPSRHPSNMADPVVKKPPKSELERVLKTESFAKAGTRYDVNQITVRNWAISYGLPLVDKRMKEQPSAIDIDAYLREHSWTEAEDHFSRVRKTLQKWLRKNGYDPRSYDKRSTQTGSNNPMARRTVRLSDSRVYETQLEAAADIGGHISLLNAALHKGGFHRGHQFMLEAEWLALGKPKLHPRTPDRALTLNR